MTPLFWINWTGVHIQMTAEIKPSIFQRKSSTSQNKTHYSSLALHESIHHLKNCKKST